MYYTKFNNKKYCDNNIFHPKNNADFDKPISHKDIDKKETPKNDKEK